MFRLVYQCHALPAICRSCYVTAVDSLTNPAASGKWHVAGRGWQEEVKVEVNGNGRRVLSSTVAND